jgi:hypothetical protein
MTLILAIASDITEYYEIFEIVRGAHAQNKLYRGKALFDKDMTVKKEYIAGQVQNVTATT